jgi:signal transduction histidine kinase
MNTGGPEQLPRWGDGVLALRGAISLAPDSGDLALEAALQRKEWQAERIINVFRVVIWLSLAFAGVLSAYWRFGGVELLYLALLPLIWSALAVANHLLVLRRRYRPAFGYLLSAADYVVAGVGFELVLGWLSSTLHLAVYGRSTAILTFLLLFLALNMLRLSWRVGLWSTGWAVLTLVITMARFDALEHLGFATAQLLLMGALVVLANRRWQVTSTAVLQEQRSMAQERTAFLQRLVAGVTHQLNSPLGAIQSGADLIQRVGAKLSRALQSEDNAAPQVIIAARTLQQVAQTNLEATHRVTNVVAALQAFSRLDEAEHKAVDVNQALDGAVALLGAEESARVTIRRAYGELPRLVCAPAYFNQALMAVLDNALLAIIGEGGTVTLSTAVVADQIEIQVADDGVGIAPEQLPRVFEAGYSRWKSWAGTGLGLTMARRTIEEQGGTLTLSSGAAGTLATARIPLMPVQP